MKRNLIYILIWILPMMVLIGCKDETHKSDSNITEEAIPAKVKEEENKTESKKVGTTHKNRTVSREKNAEVSGSRKDKLLALVNNARAKGCRCGGRYYKAVPPLTWNNRLERAAQKHSRYMRRRNLLTHAGQGGSDAGRRISAEGYDWISYGENVAAGYGSDEATIKGWLKSKGHCKNIMSPKFKEMGIASSGQFYTQVFGTKR